MNIYAYVAYVRCVRPYKNGGRRGKLRRDASSHIVHGGNCLPWPGARHAENPDQRASAAGSRLKTTCLLTSSVRSIV